MCGILLQHLSFDLHLHLFESNSDGEEKSGWGRNGREFGFDKNVAFEPRALVILRRDQWTCQGIHIQS